MESYGILTVTVQDYVLVKVAEKDYGTLTVAIRDGDIQETMASMGY